MRDSTRDESRTLVNKGFLLTEASAFELKTSDEGERRREGRRNLLLYDEGTLSWSNYLLEAIYDYKHYIPLSRTSIQASRKNPATL